MKTVHEINQHIIDKLMIAHGNVMEHCLDLDRDDQNSAYAAHVMVRAVLGAECNQRAIDVNNFEAAKHTVRIPLIEIVRRRRAAA